MHASNPQHQPTPEPRPAHLRVLVADDEPTIRRALSRLLERRGHRVDEAPDAETALERIRQHAYHAVLLDAYMPGNGRTVLDTLIETGFPGRIILMTGALAEEMAAAISRRVVPVQKPFDFDVMIRLVEEGYASAS